MQTVQEASQVEMAASCCSAGRPFRLGRIQGHAALVAVHLQERGALAVLGDGNDIAVLAAGDLFDADHVRAEIGEQRRTIGAGDVAAEIENPNAVKNLGHARLPVSQSAALYHAATRLRPEADGRRLC